MVQELSQEVACYLGIELGGIKIKRFADGEIYVQVLVCHLAANISRPACNFCICRAMCSFWCVTWLPTSPALHAISVILELSAAHQYNIILWI